MNSAFRSPRRRVLSLFLCLALGAVAGAADNPTREEWTPVKTALSENNNATAIDLLEKLLKQYPRWADGHSELARQYLKAGRPSDAEASATTALGIIATHAEAASFSIQAKNELGKPTEGFPLADTFAASTDTKSGYVFYQAALGAYQLNDIAKSDEYLKLARTHIGSTIPAQFHLLEGRLSLRQLTPDLERAETCLNRAVSSDEKLWDAWYELGRVRTARSEQLPGKADEFLTKADDAFSRILKALPNDYESWLGRGRAQLGLAKLASDRDVGDSGLHNLSEAETCLRRAINLNEKLGDAEMCLGEVLLRQQHPEEAIQHLLKARELGSTDRAVDFNLAQAYEKTGKNDQAAEVLKRLDAISPAEKITKGISYYKGARYESALRMLGMALSSPDVSNDNDLTGTLHRFSGHCWRAWAEQLEKQVGGAEGAAPSPETQRRLDEASKAYRKAGDLGDSVAQRHFLALECTQEATRAYAAAWTYLDWRGYRSPQGWCAAIGHYGASQAWRNPTHIAIWGVVFLGFLGLWLKNIFRPLATVTIRQRPSEGDSATGRTVAPRSRPADDNRSSRHDKPTPLGRRKQALQQKAKSTDAAERS